MTLFLQQEFQKRERRPTYARRHISPPPARQRRRRGRRARAIIGHARSGHYQREEAKPSLRLDFAAEARYTRQGYD